jgi:hypothetical protein
MSTRFLIAKYVPDTKRMEPRNIGVVVWNNGHIVGRFLGENSPIPRYLRVRDKITYQKWIAAWKSQLSRPILEYDRGRTANQSTPEFVDALQEWSKGNYLLVDGGIIQERVGDQETESLVQYLFKQLVEAEEIVEKKEHEYARLRTNVSRLIKSAGVTKLSDWRETEPTWYRAFGVLRNFYSDYVKGPIEKPYSIYNRVVLGDSKTFEATAFHLGSFQQSREYPKSRIAAFVVVPENPTTQQKDNREMLENIATVIDVTNPTYARDIFDKTISLNGG